MSKELVETRNSSINDESLKNRGTKSWDTKKNQLLTFSKDGVKGEIGKTDLSRIEEFMPEGTQLTKEEAITLSQYLGRVKHGFYAKIPMICCGPKCVYKEDCPLQELNKAPIGHKCSLEMYQMEQWINQYVDDLDIDPESKTEMSLIYELVKYDIMEGRVHSYMSANPGIIKKDIIGIDAETGKPIEAENINKAFAVAKDCTMIRKKLLESLLATREAKSKDVNAKIKGASYSMKDLLTKVNDVIEADNVQPITFAHEDEEEAEVTEEAQMEAIP